MKSPTIFIVGLFGLFWISSCKKLDDFTKFQLEYTTEVTVPASTGLNLPINLFSPDIKTNSEQEFAANDTRKDMIESIFLNRLVLTLLSPEGEDFSFLEEAEVFISADGLEKASVAKFDNIGNQVGTQLEATAQGLDLAPYIKKDAFKLELEAVTDEFLNRDHVIAIESLFDVDAEVLGQ